MNYGGEKFRKIFEKIFILKLSRWKIGEK